MPIDKSKIENNKKIILGVLLATSIIGGLGYYFASNKEPSEELTQKIIEENQETESDNQNNNKKNIENQSEITINNEYIPIIDNLWLNIPAFLIAQILVRSCVASMFKNSGLTELINKFNFLKFFSIFLCWQLFFYIIWFILMLIFAGFSKIWDKKHPWWSNVKKGFFRNRIHRGWWSLIPSLTPIIILILLAIWNEKRKKIKKK